jgi:hypothetical protein
MSETDKTDGGAVDNTSPDTSLSNSEEEVGSLGDEQANQALEAAFAAGFDEEDTSDGTVGEESIKSESEREIQNQPAGTEPQPKTVAETEVTNPDAPRRPGRRERELAAAENRARAAEERLSQMEAEAAEAQLNAAKPQPDEDGLYDAEDLLKYQQAVNQQTIQSEIGKVRAEIAQREQAAAQTETINQTDILAREIKDKYPVLDPNSSSFNQKTTDYVMGRAMEVAEILHSQGKTADIPGAMREVMVEAMDAFSDLGSAASRQTAQGLSQLRESSAVVSSNAGTVSEGEAAFFDGWDEP